MRILRRRLPVRRQTLILLRGLPPVERRQKTGGLLGQIAGNRKRRIARKGMVRAAGFLGLRGKVCCEGSCRGRCQANGKVTSQDCPNATIFHLHLKKISTPPQPESINLQRRFSRFQDAAFSHGFRQRGIDTVPAEQRYKHPCGNATCLIWSGRRGSNPQPTAWEAATLPLSYSRPRET